MSLRRFSSELLESRFHAPDGVEGTAVGSEHLVAVGAGSSPSSINEPLVARAADVERAHTYIDLRVISLGVSRRRSNQSDRSNQLDQLESELDEWAGWIEQELIVTYQRFQSSPSSICSRSRCSFHSYHSTSPLRTRPCCCAFVYGLSVWSSELSA